VGGDGIAGQSGPSTWITYGRRKQRNGRTAGASAQGGGRLQQLNPLLRVSSLKDAWALIGVPKTSRDMKKDCDKPGCPTDHRRQVLARGDEDRMTSANGTFRTWRDVRLESVMRTIADID
jgi:hypothetical protein